MLDDGIC